jgi:hypothetical protein
MDAEIEVLAVEKLAAGRSAARSLGQLDMPHADEELGRSIPLGRNWIQSKVAGFPRGVDSLTRSRVVDEVAAALDADEPVQALAWCNAWGYGNRGYGVSRHNAIVADKARAATRLEVALEHIRDQKPLDAYYALRNEKVARLKGFGPAFFTKFLYFADKAIHRNEREDVGRVEPLILDAVVARQLRRLKLPGFSPKSAGWNTSEYAFYLGFANAITSGPRDRVEAELFWLGRRPSAT